MFIDLDFFDVFYAVTVAMGFGVAFYFANRHANKELINEIREQNAIQLHRINDLDNAIAELKQELYEDEELNINLRFPPGEEEDDSEEI